MTGPWSLVLGSWSVLCLTAGGAFAQEPKVAVRDVGVVNCADRSGRPLLALAQPADRRGPAPQRVRGPRAEDLQRTEVWRFDHRSLHGFGGRRRSRPNAKTTVVEDNTAAAKKEARDADVIQQLKVTVTIEAVDAAKQLVTYKSADNRSVTRAVSDRRLIEDLKRGDTVEVTYTRERAIEIVKNP